MLRLSVTSRLIAAGLVLALVPVDGVAQHAPAVADGLHNRAARLYVRGLTQERDGNHQAAIDLFIQASRHAPKEAAIYLSLSEAHHNLEQHDVALFYAEQAASLSDDAQYVHHLARSQLRSGKPELAAQTYDRLLERETVDTDAVFEAARLKVHLGRDAEAATAFERLIRMVGDDRVLRTQLLQLYGRLDDVDGVERTLSALIQLQSSSEQYYLLLSDFYQRRDRLEDAIDILEQGMQDADEPYDVVSELITLYRSSGEHVRADSLATTLMNVDALSEDQIARRAEKAYLRASVDPSSTETAITLLTQALETSPGDVSLLIMLGDLHFSRGDFSESAALLSEALDKNPRNAELWVQTALAHLNAGALAEAAAKAADAILLFPGQIELYIVGGHANTQLYRTAEAIELFETAVELLADDERWDRRLAAEAHAALGFLYSRRDDHVASDDHYRRAIRIDSTNTFALNNYAYSLAERKTKLSEARELAMRAVELEPENAAFLDTAGWILFQQGEVTSAYELVLRAVNTGEASATVHMHLGDIELARGNRDGARARWQEALKLDPDNVAVKSKLGQLSP
ncbi:MAG: tetratricopeptide repeat protein [Rhodothermia bacterium]|nr:tetratricopeptide repeat protein [Rhodothermia bacterium]